MALLVENSIKESSTAHSIASIASILCLVVTLLGIKFKWFRHRLTFEGLPTAPTNTNTNSRSIVTPSSGIYRPSTEFDSFVEIRPPKQLPPVRIPNSGTNTTRKLVLSHPPSRQISQEQNGNIRSHPPLQRTPIISPINQQQSTREEFDYPSTSKNQQFDYTTNRNHNLRIVTEQEIIDDDLKNDFIEIPPLPKTPPPTAVRSVYFTDDITNERIIPIARPETSAVKFIPPPPEYTPPTPGSSIDFEVVELRSPKNQSINAPIKLNNEELTLRHPQTIPQTENLEKSESPTKSGFFGFNKSKTKVKPETKETMKPQPAQNVLKFVRIKKEKEAKKDKSKKEEKNKTKIIATTSSPGSSNIELRQQRHDDEMIKPARRMTGINYLQPDNPINLDSFQLNGADNSTTDNTYKPFMFKLEGFQNESEDDDVIIERKDLIKSNANVTLSQRNHQTIDYDKNKQNNTTDFGEDDDDDDVWNMVARHRKNVTNVSAIQQQQTQKNPLAQQQQQRTLQQINSINITTGPIQKQNNNNNNNNNKNNTAMTIDKPKTLREMQKEQNKIALTNNNHRHYTNNNQNNKQNINTNDDGNGFNLRQKNNNNKNNNNSESDTEA